MENQQTNVANGDASQRPSGGRLVWRKADNWTAFTDGFRTWVNGPRGLQHRLDTERHSWEGDVGAPGTTRIADAPPPPPARPPVVQPAPAPFRDLNCPDFPSQAAAQAELRRDPTDPHRVPVGTPPHQSPHVVMPAHHIRSYRLGMQANAGNAAEVHPHAGHGPGAP